MWGLAPLYWLAPNDGLTLLVLQDLSIVAGELIAVSWLWALVQRKGIGSRAGALCTGLMVLLFVANPWQYRVASQDFHFETIGACLALGAGRALWSGRARLATLLVLLTLSTGDVGATYVIAMGVAAAIGFQGFRRSGALTAASGLVWVAVLAGLSANKGSAINGYEYLATHPPPPGQTSISGIVKGFLAHPHRALHRLHTVKWMLWDNILPIGIVGILDPLMIIPTCLVLLENGLNHFKAFIGPGFQNAPAYLFGGFGFGALLVRVLRRRGWPLVVGTVLAATCLGSSLYYDISTMSEEHITPFSVSAQSATELGAVRAATPGGAEVVSTFGVVGRFSGRRWVYELSAPAQVVPVNTRQVEFVLAPSAGNEPLSAETVQDIQRYVTRSLHAQVIHDGPTVWAYLWQANPLVRSVTLPS